MTASGSARCTRSYDVIGGYTARSRAAQLLHGLGFSSADEERPVSAFSGGWRMRLNLARALMCRSDLLLLDEPTNHLDLDAVIWLENWLCAYAGTLLLISHDRDFLDQCGQPHRPHRTPAAHALQRQLLGVRTPARGSAWPVSSRNTKSSSARSRTCTPSSSASAPRPPRRARPRAD